MDSGQTGRFRELLASERRSADLYEGLAGAATGERREVLNELAAVEREHAAHWAAKLVELGEPVPEQGPVGVRTRVLAWLARRFSVLALLPYLERAERADAGLYQDDPDATSKMAIDERSHSRVLTQLRDGGVDDPGVFAGSSAGTAVTARAPCAPGCSVSTTVWCPTPRWSWASRARGPAPR